MGVFGNLPQIWGGAENVKKQDDPLICGWGRRYEFNVKEKKL